MADVVQEVPAEMDADQAGTLLNARFEQAEKKGPVKDPATGKFVSAKPKEDAGEGNEEGADDDKETATDKAEQKAKDGEELTKAEVRLLKVKLDGMEQEVPEDEVVKGYLRQSDYTKKTQAHAEAVKKFEAEERAVVRQERQAYVERMTLLEEAIEALTPSQEPDWEAEARHLTPEEFGQRFGAWKANRVRADKIRAERERVIAIHEADTQKQRASLLAKEREALHLALPDLKDPEKGASLEKDLRAYAISIGYTDDGVDSVEDHRLMVMLNKARLWDESQKRRPKVEEKVDRALQAMKPDGTKPAPPSKKVDALRGNLTKSGSIEDAAKLLDTFMSG